MEETSKERTKGLTPRQQRKALEWLDEMAQGGRNTVVLRLTKDGALQECVEDEFVKR